MLSRCEVFFFFLFHWPRSKKDRLLINWFNPNRAQERGRLTDRFLSQMAKAEGGKELRWSNGSKLENRLRLSRGFRFGVWRNDQNSFAGIRSIYSFAVFRSLDLWLHHIFFPKIFLSADGKQASLYTEWEFHGIIESRRADVSGGLLQGTSCHVTSHRHGLFPYNIEGLDVIISFLLYHNLHDMPTNSACKQTPCLLLFCRCSTFNVAEHPWSELVSHVLRCSSRKRSLPRQLPFHLALFTREHKRDCSEDSFYKCPINVSLRKTSLWRW